MSYDQQLADALSEIETLRERLRRAESFAATAHGEEAWTDLVTRYNAALAEIVLLRDLLREAREATS